MAFKTNGVIRIATDGGANLGLTTATEFDGKVSKKAITEQTDGDDSNVTGADEILLYDNQTDDLLRVTVDEFIAGADIGVLVASVRNTTGSTIAAGTPVHVSGYNNGTDRYEISVAEADDPLTMPADGVLQEELANNTNGLMVTYGQVSNLDTSAFTVGDELYVADGGGLTDTRPTGTGSEVEKLAVVLRSNNTQGVILVKGAGRSNDVPNNISITGDITARNLDITGVTTMSDHLIIDDGTGLGSEYALNVKTSGTSRFGVLGNGAVLLGNSSASPFIAVNEHHATSKKYVDDAISSASFSSVTLTGGPVWSSGTGTPEGSLTAPVGSLYSRTDGGAGTTLYVKESGTGNTGWVGK